MIMKKSKIYKPTNNSNRNQIKIIKMMIWIMVVNLNLRELEIKALEIKQIILTKH